MDREDMPNAEEVRRKRLASMEQRSSTATSTEPGNSQLIPVPIVDPANASLVVSEPSSSNASSPNGTIINNSYLVIDSAQLKTVMSSVLPELVNAMVLKAKLPANRFAHTSGHDDSREGRTRVLGRSKTMKLPMSFEWGNTVVRFPNWRDFPAELPASSICKKSKPEGNEERKALQFVNDVIAILSTDGKKRRKKLAKVSCSICCDGSISHMLPCHHCFCELCILKFMEQNQGCPHCRKGFSVYHELRR